MGEVISQAFTMLFGKIAEVVQWIAELITAVFTAVWDLLRDVVCWGFEEAMKVAVSGVQGIDVSGISTNLTVWGEIPAEVLNILQLLGVGQAMAIIAAAIGIRLVLQLIPFTRLGS